MKLIKFNASQLIAISFFWMIVATMVIFNTLSLPGYDAFYNVRIAEIMSEGNWTIAEFPWTTCSIWHDSYFDKEWFFHVYLIPFVILFGKVQGGKIATMVAVFFIALAWGVLLKCLGLKKHLFSAMLFMLFSTGYVFLGRIVLCRSLLFSLIFLPLAITCAIRKKRMLLLLTVYFYTLAYVGAWQVLPIIMIFDAFSFKKDLAWRESLKKMMFPWVVAGLLAGVILNPYFPVNIKGIFIQTILVLKAKWFGVGGGKILQASELAPLGLKRILWHLPLFIIYGFTVNSMWKNRTIKEVRRPVGVFFILTSLYLVLTIFSQRFIEYLAPFSAVFIFLYWSEFPLKNMLKSSVPENSESDAKFHFTSQQLNIILILALLIFGTVSTIMLHKNFYRDHLFYEKSANWLNKSVEKNSIIFTGDWDMGAVLFCNAPEFRYLVMLEPYFMYAYSPEKYFLWNKICSGKLTDPSVTIVKEFNSKIVFVPHDRPVLLKKLQQDKNAQLEFEGETGESIFSLHVSENDLQKAETLKKWIKKKSNR